MSDIRYVDPPLRKPDPEESALPSREQRARIKNCDLCTGRIRTRTPVIRMKIREYASWGYNRELAATRIVNLNFCTECTKAFADFIVERGNPQKENPAE